MGISNAVVSNCRPDELCKRLENRFDRILVDAPCSGEGMFRKNDAEREWSIEHVKSCAARQLLILNGAKDALKNGGYMVYSTCTFSKEENEGVISRFLAENPNIVFSKEELFEKIWGFEYVSDRGDGIGSCEPSEREN